MHKQREPKFKPILGGFIPLASLWVEDSPAPMTFPSEHAARWYVRQNREQLAAGSAILQLGNRLYIHPERFETAAIRAGIDAAARRARG